MKVLLVYDSVFGNTEKVARAIAEALGLGEAGIVKVSDVRSEQLKGLDLLIVGSPTRAFRPTKPISTFLDKIPNGSLKGVKVAAFDTRANMDEVKSKFLNVMVKAFGYAAEPIAKKLERKGGHIAIEPGAFFVKDSEGPLKDGELARAAGWAKRTLG